MVKLKSAPPTEVFERVFEILEGNNPIALLGFNRNSPVSENVYVGVNFYVLPDFRLLRELRRFDWPSGWNFYCNVTDDVTQRFAEFFGFSLVTRVNDVRLMQRRT